MLLGVILAGGQSRRMGRDKSQLIFQGKSLIQHAQDVLSELGCDDVVLSGQHGVPDLFPDRGPVGGIVSVVLQQKLSVNDRLMVIPVDMPLLDVELLKELASTSMQTGQTCYFDSYFMPLSAVLNEDFFSTVVAVLEQGQTLSVRSLLATLGATCLACSEQRKFINVNCPEQWQQLTSADS